MSDESRKLLARQQEQLVRALKLGHPAPDGFDPAALQLAGDSLLNKRARTVAKVFPRLAESLGTQFQSFFHEYAREHKQPADGPTSDGTLFAGWLYQRLDLHDSIGIELAHIKLRHGFPMRLFRLRPSGPFVAGIRMGRYTRVIQFPGWPLRTGNSCNPHRDSPRT